MSAIRVALIGAEVIGRAHAAILAKLPRDEAVVVAIADPSEAAAAFAATPDMPCYADATATLAVLRSAAIGAPVQPEEPAERRAQ